MRAQLTAAFVPGNPMTDAQMETLTLLYRLGEAIEDEDWTASRVIHEHVLEFVSTGRHPLRADSVGGAVGAGAEDGDRHSLRVRH